ncbi:DUF4168 domain-containing protein [Nodosilinea sp. LEGE 07088]|uniref:DUF4168 domain-containing protein n=1 Tax=Nodosilinea sp. LEGE 07088 TaxID=2777968 RepID=UPI00187F17DE|nr:DUF4168 domain-containing protein [Nodosilinea sp. LEGE 07088]MBE9137162.1 DUF4168 domain-containing protein [Nodosilinea sp. LEGE 07088]
MIHPFINFLPPARRTLVVASMASLAVLVGGAGIPIPAGEGIRLGAAAQAQDRDISPEEIVGYATSVLEMDSHRSEAYGEIQTLLTGTGYNIGSIDISCMGTANLNQLSRSLRNSVRAIVVDYCNQASTIVEANGLTVRRFNAITAAHPQDPALAEQIRTVMVELQQSQESSQSSNSSAN